MEDQRLGDIAIVGAGPAGLTAALELVRRTGARPLVFEADSQVGGISKTVEFEGNRMDLGGHRFFSKSDWVMNFWQEILPVEDAAHASRVGLNLAYQGATRPFTPAPGAGGAIAPGAPALMVRQRLSRILYRRRFFDYPLRLTPRTLANLGALQVAAIGTSYVGARLRPRHPETSLEDFLINRFGERLYQTFFRSYTEKVWGVPCHEISAEWGAQRIKGLSITRALVHAARGLVPRFLVGSPAVTETSLIESFLYPRLGPGQMWEQVAARVTAAGGEVHLRHRVVGIARDGTRVTGIDVIDDAGGAARRIPCTALISTMPIGQLVAQLGPDTAPLAATAAELPHRDFLTVGLLLRRMGNPGSAGANATGYPPDNWIYVQEPDVRLGRIQIFNNWSPHLVADPATVWLGLEYFCQAGDDLWSMTDAGLIDFAAIELERLGLARRPDVL